MISDEIFKKAQKYGIEQIEKIEKHYMLNSNAVELSRDEAYELVGDDQWWSKEVAPYEVNDDVVFKFIADCEVDHGYGDYDFSVDRKYYLEVSIIHYKTEDELRKDIEKFEALAEKTKKRKIADKKRKEEEKRRQEEEEKKLLETLAAKYGKKVV
jgi:hypothetical protein